METSTKTTNKPDLLIIIMGPTGAGKSTYANRLLGRPVMHAPQNSMDSVTQDVQAAYMDESSELHVLANGLNCGRAVVVDTPGFDDSQRGDLDILKLIADWLIEAYKRRDAIGVLVYVHDISADRFTGSAAANLSLFRNLIGQYSFSNVILGTTKRSKLNDKNAAEERTRSVISRYWQELVDGGAVVASLDPPLAGQPILDCMRKATFRPALLQLELVVQHKSLADTAAGRALTRHFLNGLLRMHDLSGSQVTRKELETMLKRLEKADKQAEKDQLSLSKIDKIARLQSSDGFDGGDKGNMLKRVTTKIAGVFSRD